MIGHLPFLHLQHTDFTDLFKVISSPEDEIVVLNNGTNGNVYDLSKKIWAPDDKILRGDNTGVYGRPRKNVVALPVKGVDVQRKS